MQQNPQWQFDLIVSHAKLTTALLAAGSPAAREHARRARAQALLWAERFPQDPRRDAVLASIEQLARAAGAAD